MPSPKNPNVTPCVIGEGTIYNKKDMLRALETVDSFSFEDYVEDRLVCSGEGSLIKVFASRNAATIFINRCLFVNVFSFNYLNFRTMPSGRTEIELVSDSRLLRLLTSEEAEEPRPARLRQVQQEADQFGDDETYALLEDLEDEDD